MELCEDFPPCLIQPGEYLKQVLAVATVSMLYPVFLHAPYVPFPFPGQSVGWMNHCGRDSWLFVPRNLWACPLLGCIAWMVCDRNLRENGTRKNVRAPADASQVIPRVVLTKEVPGRGCRKPSSTGGGSSQALFNLFDFSWSSLGVLGMSCCVTALEQQVQLSLRWCHLLCRSCPAKGPLQSLGETKPNSSGSAEVTLFRIAFCFHFLNFYCDIWCAWPTLSPLADVLLLCFTFSAGKSWLYAEVQQIIFSNRVTNYFTLLNIVLNTSVAVFMKNI